MISRNVTNHRIRYILGATGEGHRRLRQVPVERLSCIDYVFIDNNESLRSWLLSNPVLDDPLDLMIYCNHDEGDDRPETPSLRAHHYLGEDAVSDWADAAAGHIGQMHYRTPYVPPRFNSVGSNRSGGHENAGAPDVFSIKVSNSLSDPVDTRDRGQDSTGTPSPVGDTVPSPIAYVPLAVKSSNQLNAPMSPDRLVRQRHTGETLKRGAPDDENFNISKFKKTPLGALEGEPMKGIEVHIQVGGDAKSDNCEEPVSRRLGSIAGGSSRNVPDDGIIIPVEEHRDSGESGGTGNAHMYKGTPECGHQERSRV